MHGVDKLEMAPADSVSLGSAAAAASDYCDADAAAQAIPLRNTPNEAAVM